MYRGIFKGGYRGTGVLLKGDARVPLRGVLGVPLKEGMGSSFKRGYRGSFKGGYRGLYRNMYGVYGLGFRVSSQKERASQALALPGTVPQ